MLTDYFSIDLFFSFLFFLSALQLQEFRRVTVYAQFFPSISFLQNFISLNSCYRTFLSWKMRQTVLSTVHYYCILLFQHCKVYWMPCSIVIVSKQKESSLRPPFIPSYYTWSSSYFEIVFSSWKKIKKLYPFFPFSKIRQ